MLVDLEMILELEQFLKASRGHLQWPIRLALNFIVGVGASNKLLRVTLTGFFSNLVKLDVR